MMLMTSEPVGERTPFVWKHSFPLETSEDEAIREAVRECVTQKVVLHTTQVDVTGTAIVRTHEHTAAGEFIVRVEGVTFEGATFETEETAP